MLTDFLPLFKPTQIPKPRFEMCGLDLNKINLLIDNNITYDILPQIG